MKINAREPSDLMKAVVSWIRKNAGNQDKLCASLGIKKGTFAARLSRGLVKADFFVIVCRAMGKPLVNTDEIMDLLIGSKVDQSTRKHTEPTNLVRVKSASKKTKDLVSGLDPDRMYSAGMIAEALPGGERTKAQRSLWALAKRHGFPEKGDGPPEFITGYGWVSVWSGRRWRSAAGIDDQ